MGLTARERRRALPQSQIAEPDLTQGLELARDGRKLRKKLHRIVHREVQYLRDVLATPPHLQHPRHETLPTADLAWKRDFREEMHVVGDHSRPLTRLTTPARDIEGKCGFPEPSRARLTCLRKELTDGIVGLHVGYRIRAHGSSDRCLINENDLIQMLEPLDPLAAPHLIHRLLLVAQPVAVKHLMDKRRLAAS